MTALELCGAAARAGAKYLNLPPVVVVVASSSVGDGTRQEFRIFFCVLPHVERKQFVAEHAGAAAVAHEEGVEGPRETPGDGSATKPRTGIGIGEQREEEEACRLAETGRGGSGGTGTDSSSGIQRAET